MLTIGLGSVSASGGGGTKKASLIDWPLTKLDISVKTDEAYLAPVDTSMVTKISITGNKLTELPSLDLTNVANFSNSFQQLTLLKKIDIKTSKKLTNLYYAFSACSALEEIILFDTSKVTNWNTTFSGCKKLKEIPPFDMSEGTVFNATFESCSSLESLDLDVPKAANFISTFYQCGSLRSVKLNNAIAKDWSRAFYYCSNLENVEIDMTNATNTNNMFYGARSIVELKIKNLGISISINDSPLISKTSVLYLFENAQTVTSSPTITLHADVFGQLTEDEIAIATEKGFSVVSA